jgi:hypothetical protein
MDEDPNQEPKPEPTQYTPKGHEIPIPTREQIFRDLEKVAKPQRPLPASRRRRIRRPKEQ